jgi:flagellin-specific chaperone FliS
LQQYTAELNVIHQALEKNDADKLQEIFSLAREVRSAWTQQ